VAWIQVHQALGTHRKTYLLADALEIIPAQAVGHLALLWTWALDNAPDGSLDGSPASVIARAAQWTGDARTFLDALTDAGFVDLAEDGLRLHDWEEYAGNLLGIWEANKNRSRTWREARRARLSAAAQEKRENAERDANAYGTHTERIPYAQRMAQEERRGEENNPLPPAGGTVLLEVSPEKVADRFGEWWLSYPHKGTRSHKGQARSSWDARLAEGVPAAVIIGHTRHMAADEEWQREDGRAVPGAHRYLAKTDFSLPSVLAAASGAGPEQFRYLDDVEADRG
jgi:hypothetical protein